MQTEQGVRRLAQFEGSFEPGARVLLVDDLATDGVSETAFRTALQRAEATVLDTFVLIDFDVFPTNHTYLSLAKLSHIIEAAKESGYLGANDVAEIENFSRDAPAWSRVHGGIGGL